MVDHVALLLIDPAGQCNEEELERRQEREHGRSVSEAPSSTIVEAERARDGQRQLGRDAAEVSIEFLDTTGFRHARSRANSGSAVTPWTCGAPVTNDSGSRDLFEISPASDVDVRDRQRCC